MAKFEDKSRELFIDGKKVLRAWESYSGWYWFAIKIDGDKAFGFVQGLSEEWGEFSIKELESLKPKVWEIQKKNFYLSGRRS